MITTNLWKAVGAAVLLFLLIWAGTSIFTSCRAKQANQHQQDSAMAHGQALEHAGVAQAIPQHAAEIQAAKDQAKAAEAKAQTSEASAARARRERDAALAKLATKPPTQPDERDDVIAKDRVLIEAQVTQIAGLQQQVQAGALYSSKLELALSDETKRSSEWKAAFESEQKSRVAQEAATKAWKSAVTASEWKGGLKGAAVGVLAALLIKK